MRNQMTWNLLFIVQVDKASSIFKFLSQEEKQKSCGKLFRRKNLSRNIDTETKTFLNGESWLKWYVLQVGGIPKYQTERLQIEHLCFGIWK